MEDNKSVIGPQKGQLEAVRENLLNKHADEEIEYCTCCQNGCFDMCLLKCHKKDGKLVAIETDNEVHPNCAREDSYYEMDEFYKGMYQHRACVRGRGWRKDVYSPNRIKYPMLRVGPKGSKKFKRISWDEALDLLAKKYVETREKYGPMSVYCDGLMGGSTDYIGQYMPGGAMAIWGVDSYEPHDLADTYSYGRPLTMDAATFDGGTEAMTLFDTKAIVLWGFDVVLNYPEFSYYFMLARDKGIPVIYIDPRYTWTAHLADQWIPIRPSTDGAMLEAMAYVILSEGLEDKKFTEELMEPNGLARWKDYIFGGFDNIPKTPEWAETICGIPAETIAEIARLCADGPVYMRQVWAATRILGGENQARTYNYLCAICGNVGRKGTIGTGMDFGVRPHFSRPGLADYGQDYSAIEEHCVIEGEIWHQAVLNWPRYENGEISLDEYKQIVGCPADETAPNIQMIWQTVNPRNMVPNYYDSSARLQAILMVPFVAYCAYTWATTTAWYADLVLPIPHQFFEGGGGDNFVLQGYSFNNHFSGAAGNYMIGMGKVIEPPGECRSKLWILKEIAERVGVVDKYCPKLKGVKWEDFDTTLEEMAKVNFNIWRENPDIKQYDPPTWEEFRKVPYYIRPIEGDYWVCLNENVEGGKPFDTRSGKIEIVSHFVEEHDYHHMSYETKCLGKGYITPIGMYQQCEVSQLSPLANTYPLYMITPHAFYRQHFCEDENPWFRDEYRMSVWISAADAKTRGIKDGDLVMAHNNVGQCMVPAYVTSRLMPGVTCMIFGRNYEPSDIKTEIMPEGIDLAGSCNFLIPSEDYNHRRGILLCAGMIEITKVIGGAPSPSSFVTVEGE